MKRTSEDCDTLSTIHTKGLYGLYHFLNTLLRQNNGELSVERVSTLLKRRFTDFEPEELTYLLSIGDMFETDGQKVWSQAIKIELERAARLSEIRSNASRKRWTKSVNKPLSAKSRKKFQPPTLEEVQSYVEENQFEVNAMHFINYYQARGWQTGRSKIVDWRAAVRTWTAKADSAGKKSVRTDYDSRFVNDEWENFKLETTE